MAFTGAAVITQISDRKVRITGLSLAALAAGTISGPNGTGAVKWPAGFNPKAYRGSTGTPGGSVVPMADSVQLSYVPNGAVITASSPCEVVKTGSTDEDFLFTLTNNHATIAGPNLEIYIEFH